MSDDAKRLRNAAARLRVTVQEMLAPASATPSPQRVKLDKAMHDVEQAVHAWDAAQTVKRGTIADALEIVSEYNRGELDQMEAEHGNGDDG